MKLVEVGTFILLVLFVAGMTIKHQENIQLDKQRVTDYHKGIEVDKELAEIAKNTKVVTIPHDENLETKTVVVNLSASSFDGGNAAQYLTVTRKVDNTSKPICKKWDDKKSCEDPKDIYDQDYFNDCCEVPLVDKCDKQVYEPLCAEYQKGCDVLNNLDDCICVKDKTETVEYMKDCSYTHRDYNGRVEYVKNGMRVPLVQDTDLDYLWEKVSGPEPVYATDMEKSNVSMELMRGKYTFKCTVVDNYGYTNSITKNVEVIAEANNKPEVSIKADQANPALSKEIMDKRKKEEKANDSSQAAG